MNEWLWRLDRSVPPTDYWFSAERGDRGTRISLKFLFAQKSEGQQEWGGWLGFRVPTDRWLQKPARVVAPTTVATSDEHGAAQREVPPAKKACSPPVQGSRSRAKQLPSCDEAPEAASSLRPYGPSKKSAPVRISPADAQAAVRAALRHSGANGRAQNLDALATRARWSAALPGLRLRVTRLVDESESLSPTSYDAQRMTSSGGASLWLEARASWQLDRALFASEEVRIAKLKQQFATARSRLSERVLDVLFAWHAARIDLRVPALPPKQCRATWVKEQRLGAELQLLTGGWFARWQRRRGAGALEYPCQ